MFAGLFAAAALSVAAWVAGRAHLKATVLAPIDKAAHLPPGTLEDKINAAVVMSSQTVALRAAVAASDAADKKLGLGSRLGTL